MNTLFKKVVNKYKKFTDQQSFALNQIDINLKSYLNFKNGYFVEAGANDGISQSNTLYFEKYKSWQGLLIEPIPSLVEKCIINRPKCTVESCALVPLGFEGSYIKMQYSGLMSLVKGAMKSEEEELNHIKIGCTIQNIETYEVQVPTMSLSSIIDKHSIKKIDFLSLDIEGFELSALKGIDFDRHRPIFMLIEARYRNEIDGFLKPLYEPVAELTHHDVLYRSCAA